MRLNSNIRKEQFVIEYEDKYFEAVFCVSLLGPYYCIYEKITNQISDISVTFIGLLYDVFFHFNEAEFPNSLIEELRIVGNSFNLQEVVSEDFTQHTKGLSFFGISEENFTIFNGLFKDSF